MTSTTLDGNTLKIKVDEVVVNGINLRFENRKSGEVRAEGKTKPDVILRHILSQPGKVIPGLMPCHMCSYWPLCPEGCVELSILVLSLLRWKTIL